MSCTLKMWKYLVSSSLAQEFFPSKIEWWRGVRPRESVELTCAPCWRRSSIRFSSPIWQAMCNNVHPCRSFIVAPDASLVLGLPVGSCPRPGLDTADRDSDTPCKDGSRGPLQLLRVLWEPLPLRESAPARLASGDREDGSEATIACSKVVLAFASPVINRRSTTWTLFVVTASQTCLAADGPRESTLSFCINLRSTYCTNQKIEC